MVDAIPVASSDSCPGSTSPEQEAKAKIQVPLHPKRSHRKSRLGCTTCKLRKVKCDEVRPACRACRMRQTTCEYRAVAPRKPPPSWSSNRRPKCGAASLVRLVNEPLVCLPSTDAVDMRLLWFYTSSTYRSLSYPDDKQRPMDDMLQTVLVQHAFEVPFLMDSILELASLHMQSLGQTWEPTRALIYRARSFEGFRKAISDKRPSTYGALLANSVLRPILATHFFRDSSCEDLYLLDWMVLWRGVKPIIEITGVASINDSGMKPLFARPLVVTDSSALAIPKDLLLMMSFIDHDDPDLAEIQTYQDSLRALGSLFENLRHGVDSIMVLRIVTWGSLVPDRLIDLARRGRERALVILSHYAAFLKLLQNIWWLAGVGGPSIQVIHQMLEPEWHGYMSIPLSALVVEDAADLTRALLGTKDAQL